MKARTLEQFRARLAAALADTFVIGPKGAPDGFFMLKGDELYQFYVARAARGSGVADALMEAAEAELARRGVATPWLACGIGNDRAARFYEKRGWVNARRQTNRLETPEGVFEFEVWRYEERDCVEWATEARFWPPRWCDDAAGNPGGHAIPGNGTGL